MKTYLYLYKNYFLQHNYVTVNTELNTSLESNLTCRGLKTITVCLKQHGFLMQARL